MGDGGLLALQRCPFTGPVGSTPAARTDLGGGEPYRCVKGPMPAISRVSWIIAATITPPTTDASTRVGVEATERVMTLGVTSARQIPNCVRICWRAWAVTIG